MKILELSQQGEQALSMVCEAALASMRTPGLQVKAWVNFIESNIKIVPDEKPADSKVEAIG